MTNAWKQLDVAVIGGGLGGLAAGLALRRAGHKVRIYERYDYGGEIGSSISVAANGGKWLHEWGVDVKKAKPVILTKLIRHNWESGEIEGVYPFGDYEKLFGYPYYNVHRKDLHDLLQRVVVSPDGAGTPCELILKHKAVVVDYETGHIKFENGEETSAELIVAADGIRTTTKAQLGITPTFGTSNSCCYHLLMRRADLIANGLTDFSVEKAIEFWGGDDKNKIVLSSCSDGEIISCYCFYAATAADTRDGWHNSATRDELFQVLKKNLDPKIADAFAKVSFDIKQWRLYVHEPLPYFYKTSRKGDVGVCLLGDAAHAMMPDQSQGAVAAFEDAGALGYIFSKEFIENTGVVPSLAGGLKLYESERMPRVTKIQAASLRARENLKERIGWSTDGVDSPDKLTIEEVCGYEPKTHMDGLAREILRA